jgi:glutamate 5-kinase
MRRPVPAAASLVVKIGSSSLTSPEGGIDDQAIERVVAMVAEAWGRGHPAVLVSSGAVAAGMPALGLTVRPGTIADLQVAAAVGQSRLMERYTASFAARGLIAGQVLLTKEVLANREQYLNARTALSRMLAAGIVPVVNENDTVVVEELRLGDNDRLAAMVSHLVGAGLLLMLTDTAGLFASDPRLGEAELLAAVRHTDEILDRLAGTGPIGSGGAATKVAAARMAAWSGVPTVVASARAPEVLEKVLTGGEIGTWVEPNPRRLPARKLWIAFGQPAAGVVVIDDGAVAAITAHPRSLLPIGVREVRGSFPAGAGVEVHDPAEALVAKGIVKVDADTLRSLAGRRGDLEAIHRDDLVVLR